MISDKLAYVPDLVTKVVATKKSLTFTIRADANWYWGGKKLPVTYQDFVYTWQAFVNPKNDVSSRDGYDQITGFTHKGEKQVTFRWTKPYADYRDLFTPCIRPPRSRGWTSTRSGRTASAASDGKPVADGPYYVSNYTKGQGVTLKANPYWYGAKPGLKEIDLKLITDTNAEIQAMRGGEVDLIQPSPQTASRSSSTERGSAYRPTPGLYQEHSTSSSARRGSRS